MKNIEYSSPGRVDISGGGADMIGLSTISAAIDLRANVYAEKENNTKIPLINSGLKYFDLYDEDINIGLKTEIPRNSGLGGSASICVSLTNLLNDYFDLGYTKYEIAEHAQRIESKQMNQKNGYQDWYASEFGNILYMNFNGKDNKSIYKEPFASIEKINCNLNIVVSDTGIKHYSGFSNDSIYKKYNIGDSKIRNIFQKMERTTRECKYAMKDKDILKVGDVINENQKYVKLLNRSCEESEKLIDCASSNGALASKVTGAGNGGFVMSLCETKSDQRNVHESLKEISPFVHMCKIDKGCCKI